MVDRGIVLIAHNNEKLDYGLMAFCTALMVKYNLAENHITLITDSDTLKALKENKGTELVNEAFDNIIELSEKETPSFSQYRGYKNTAVLPRIKASYRNQNRASAYELSPYKETLLLDVDYLVMDDRLDLVWNHAEDLLINYNATTLYHDEMPKEDVRLDQLGIRMYWATVVYFRKTEVNELLFGLINHIREHWEFYQFVYGFKGGLYRNDFAFSIAIHMLNSFVESNSICHPLPVDTILTSLDRDNIIKVKDVNELIFLVDDPNNQGPYPTKIKNTSVHCMNKFAMLKYADELIKLYTSEAKNV